MSCDSRKCLRPKIKKKRTRRGAESRQGGKRLYRDVACRKFEVSLPAPLCFRHLPVVSLGWKCCANAVFVFTDNNFSFS